MIGAALPALLTGVVACSAHPRGAAPVAAYSAAPVAPSVLSAEQLRSDAAISPRIAQLLAEPGNSDVALAPDGKLLLFMSDRSGTNDLYVANVAEPEAAPRQLVTASERVMSPVFTGDSRAILYRQDHGSDENYHVLRISVDGGRAVDLTPGEERWRDTPLLPRGRPDLMIYSARKPSDYTSSLFTHDLASGNEREVYRDEVPSLALDVAPDGARALWLSEAISGGHELREIDVARGTARQLWPQSGKPARISAAAYSADGATVFIATDAGSESHFLIALESKSGLKQAEYRQEAPDTAEVGAIIVSPLGDRVVIQVDAGNHSTLRVLEAHSLATVTDLSTELGSVGLGIDSGIQFALNASAFSSDGRHFVFSSSAPDHNSNVYWADAQTGAVEALRRDGVPSAVGSGLAASVATVKAFDGLNIPVNVYLPKNTKPGALLPTIVNLHGGPNASTPLEWNLWAQLLSSLGFVVLEPNIRGSTGFGRAYELADDGDKRFDALKDLASVNEWARVQPWCDPNRLVLMGSSFGGYYVLMGLTHQPKLWRAGVDLAGPSDLQAMMESGSATGRYFTELGDPKKDAKRLAALSPIHYVDQVVAPLFVYQGQNDSRVGRAHADAIVRALRQRKVPVEYMVAMNEGHTVEHRENQIELFARILRFLSEQGVLND